MKERLGRMEADFFGLRSDAQDAHRFEKLRNEFASKVRRKHAARQDIRQVVEDKRAQMLARNPLRMDYYKKYQEISFTNGNGRMPLILNWAAFASGSSSKSRTGSWRSISKPAPTVLQKCGT